MAGNDLIRGSSDIRVCRGGEDIHYWLLVNLILLALQTLRARVSRDKLRIDSIGCIKQETTS
jgi:hypothetical protein